MHVHRVRLTEVLCKTKEGVINVNMADDAIRGLTVVKNGEITWSAPPIGCFVRCRKSIGYLVFIAHKHGCPRF